MRDLGPEAEAWIAARRDIVARQLVWITARNRATGAPESIGFWNGDQDQTFTVEGEDRLYLADGSLIAVEDVNSAVGLGVEATEVRLAGISEAIDETLRVYDARLAPVEVHRILLDAQSRLALGAPHPVLIGQLDEAPVATPTAGNVSTLRASVMRVTRALTRVLTLRKSAAAQRARGGDAFRRYSAASQTIKVRWGG